MRVTLTPDVGNESILLLQIIRQALEDLMHSEDRIRNDAYFWLVDDSQQYGSCYSICEWAGIGHAEIITRAEGIFRSGKRRAKTWLQKQAEKAENDRGNVL